MPTGENFTPTKAQRATVLDLSSFGLPHEQIGTFLGVAPKTLRKHFRHELDTGGIAATAKVAKSLFASATSGRNVAAQIFWMKARAGWSEKLEVKGDVNHNFVIHAPTPAGTGAAWLEAHAAPLLTNGSGRHDAD